MHLFRSFGENDKCTILPAKTDPDCTVKSFFDDHRIFLADGDRLFLCALIPLFFETDRKIIVHGTFELPCEDRGKCSTFFHDEWTVKIRYVRGNDGKLCVELRNEDIREKLIRLRDRTDLRQPQFLDQPILQGAKKSLDASLCLRAVCGDELDAELSGRTLELRQELVVLRSNRRVHLVGAEFIEIYRSGYSTLLHVRFPEGKDRYDAFVRCKLCLGDTSGRIINRGEQALFIRCSASFKPVMVRPIELLHLAEGGTALPPCTMG